MFRELDLMLGGLGGRMQLWGTSSDGRPVPDVGDLQAAQPMVRSLWKLAHPDQLRINQTARESPKEIRMGLTQVGQII